MIVSGPCNLQDYIGLILDNDNGEYVTVYRGHSNDNYTLKPAILRSKKLTENEHLLLRELIAAHPLEFANDPSALELLVRMQHYSLPTRLLDATWNPLVALYFAAEKSKRRISLNDGSRQKTKTVNADGQVVKLSVHRDLVRYFDSDRVSCLTNLARCSYNQKEELRKILTLEKNKFNNQDVTKRLLHFIRSEKPAFDPDIMPTDLDGIYLAKPKQNNRRILAQAGAFFVFGLIPEIPANGGSGIKIERISINADFKERLLSELNRVSINQRTLFPEIDRAASYFTEEFTKSRLLSGSL